MSLEAQWDALYRLFYKRDARSAFASGKLPAGLTKPEAEQFRAIDPARLNMVVLLHTPDIGGWYRGVPATWLALQATLNCNELELVGRLTSSDAFELRINDDEDCRALAGFIAQLPPQQTRDSRWLSDLLRYELLIAGKWPDERSPRVETFKYDVDGIRRALIEQQLCPTEEKAGQHAILFHRGKREINEVALKPDQAAALQAHLRAPRSASLNKRCLALLKAVGASLLICLALACEQRPMDAANVDKAPEVNAKSLPAIKLTPAFPKLKFNRPVWLTHVPGGNKLIVVEQYGKIRSFENKADVAASGVYLDLTDKIVRDSNEEGILCAAFHPKFAENGYCFVSYNAYNPHRSIIARFKRNAAGDALDPSSEKTILEIPQGAFNHKGCTLLFGKDGLLYASFGDGGNQHDPDGNGQNLGVRKAKVLRIDIDKEEGGKTYAIPAENPFVKRAGARPEIWAYGLRNTWRMSFDSVTGDLWGGDDGQNSWEEVNLITRGGNYGWDVREGTHAHEDGAGGPDPFIDPVVEYSDTLGRAIIGGFVYRGEKFKTMQGLYFYADHTSGRLWALRYKDGKVDANAEVLKVRRAQIASFGLDADGELYACGFGPKRLEESEILRVEIE